MSEQKKSRFASPFTSEKQLDRNRIDLVALLICKKKIYIFENQ